MKKTIRQNFALLRWSVAVCLVLCLAACGDDDEPGTPGEQGGGPLQPQTATLTLSNGKTITYGYANIWFEDDQEGAYCMLDFTSIPYAETELETKKWDDFIIDLELAEPGKLPTGSIPYASYSDLVRPSWNGIEAAEYDYTSGGNEDGSYFYMDDSENGNVSLNITKKDGGYRIEMRDMKMWDNQGDGVSGSGRELTGTFVFEGTFTPLN